MSLPNGYLECPTCGKVPTSHEQTDYPNGVRVIMGCGSKHKWAFAVSKDDAKVATTEFERVKNEQINKTVETVKETMFDKIIDKAAENNKKETDNMNTEPVGPNKFDTIKETAKDEVIQAGWNVAARKVVKLAKEPFIAAANKGGSPEMAKALKELLDSEVGNALFAMIIGTTVPMLPVQNDKLDKLTSAIRVNAMADVGDHLVDLVLEPMLEAMKHIRLPGDPLALPENIMESVSDKEKVEEKVAAKAPTAASNSRWGG